MTTTSFDENDTSQKNYRDGTVQFAKELGIKSGAIEQYLDGKYEAKEQRRTIQERGKKR